MKYFISLAIFVFAIFFTATSTRAVTITTTLDTTAPPANGAYTASTGLQAGRLNRFSPKSDCNSSKPNPGLNTPSGNRQYDSYVFTATSSGCYAIMIVTGSINTLQSVAYKGGFVPSDPSTNYAADYGTTDSTVTYFINVSQGEQFTVVVHELNVGGGNGVSYTLSVEAVSPIFAFGTLDSNVESFRAPFTTETGLQTGRLFRNSVVSTCSQPKSLPAGSPTTGSRRYNSYVFTASHSGCVRIRFQGNLQMFLVVYDGGGFAPSDPTFNYLADMGASSDLPVDLSFNVIAGQPYTIVVHEVSTDGAIGDNYSFRIDPPKNFSNFDYDGDRKSDVSVFRPSNGIWFMRNSGGTDDATQFGLSSDRIVPADYDGDGKTDIAVFRPSQGAWFIFESATGVARTQIFGNSTDIPVPGEYVGSGKARIAIYRPSNGQWWILNNSVMQFGISSDIPVPGDYDGDGIYDLAVYRPSNGVWFLRRSSSGDLAVQFGNSTDRVVPADYDGDLKTDIAIYRPTQQTWYIMNSSDGNRPVVVFGLQTDTPAPGDYDGDGRADIAIFRPSNGQWWINQSTSGLTVTQFGQNGDRPTQNAYNN